MPSYVDTHTHLYDKVYDQDRQAVFERAIEAGVTRMIMAAEDVETSRSLLELTQKHNFLYGAVGIHPGDVDKAKPQHINILDEILAGADRSKIVAIGEIGLDYYWTKENKETQQFYFREQLHLAFRHDLPVIIHDRDAHEDTLNMLFEAQAQGQLRQENPGVFHCYSGSPEFAERVLKLGFYIGLDGPVTFKNARKLIDVARTVPLDRLLLETDCPFLTPHPFRGKRNEPAYLPYIAERIAEIRGISVADVAEATTANAERLFNL
ncbi:MAG: TatD family hydrolase [Fastidiosipilaceae bacterium]|jgi:TatD DNase family protein